MVCLLVFVWYANAVQTCYSGISFPKKWASQCEVMANVGGSLEILKMVSYLHTGLFV